jgi:hypothetical protein
MYVHVGWVRICVRGGPIVIPPLHCDLQDLLCLKESLNI